MYVIPKEGLNIFDPYKKDHIPAEGREVPDGDMYWHRLNIDGDVTIKKPEIDPGKIDRSIKP